MNIVEIYEKYQIMPQLQEHMFRVAGVAHLLCGNFTLEVDTENVIKAALLHDMGNIVKFDFSLFPEIVAEKGLEYWENVKKQTAEKYGANTHTVTFNIIKDIGASERILELADSVGFSQAEDNMELKDFGKKICHYADARVGPYGVISLEERLNDLRRRYENRRISLAKNTKEREGFEEALRQIEKQIFAHCKIRPEEITEESIRPFVEKLKNWEM